MMPPRSILAGCGGYLPKRIVTNDELSRTVETSDEWIRERTGIRQRHFAAKFETAAFMGTAAARAALADAGATAADVDAIILATSTPDQAFPATALRVQAELGIKRGFGFDLSAACAGFIYGVSIADGMIRAGQARGVLVIGSEVYSRILNWQDRGTCVLFGDGAGAVFMRASEEHDDPRRGVLSTHIHAQGTLGDILYVDGAVGQPDKPGHLVMNGREVFRHAVTRLAEIGGGSAGCEWPDLCRCRLAGAAPGQPSDHRCDGTQTGFAAGTRRGHRRPPRQHLRGVSSTGVGGSTQRRPYPHRRSGAAGGFGRWPGLGIGPGSDVRCGTATRQL